MKKKGKIKKTLPNKYKMFLNLVYYPIVDSYVTLYIGTL